MSQGLKQVLFLKLCDQSSQSLKQASVIAYDIEVRLRVLGPDEQRTGHAKLVDRDISLRKPTTPPAKFLGSCVPLFLLQEFSQLGSGNVVRRNMTHGDCLTPGVTAAGEKNIITVNLGKVSFGLLSTQLEQLIVDAKITQISGQATLVQLGIHHCKNETLRRFYEIARSKFCRHRPIHPGLVD